MFAAHTLEIVEELTLDFPLGPRADVANGLDQQIDQVVCQAATAQIGKGCQPSEPRRLRVAAQLVGCFHSDASAVTLHLMPRRDQRPSKSGKLLPKWRLVTPLLGLARGGRNSHEPTLPPSLRVGQMIADSEFVISDYAALFTNGTFGWPAFLYTNIPEGGPGYPMGTLFVRVAVNPWEWMTLQSAVFQGNVFAQDVNRHGFRWDLNADQGYFWINELQVRWNQGNDAKGLPGQGKFGAWFHTEDFADPFFDEAGIPLADERSSGNARTHVWNYGFYWILDQMLYREPGEAVASSKTSEQTEGKASNQGLGWFGRIAFGPQNRNFVGFYFDTGLAYTGLIPTRDEDQVGVGFVYAQLTNGARRTLELEGSRGVGAEMVLELTYKAFLTPWLYIQPDAQLIINPGATQDLRNAFVLGGRVSINF